MDASTLWHGCQIGTLDWIDSIEKGSVFWDIGANVGLYGIYAAIKKDCIVYAFEKIECLKQLMILAFFYLEKTHNLITTNNK